MRQRCGVTELDRARQRARAEQVPPASCSSTFAQLSRGAPSMARIVEGAAAVAGAENLCSTRAAYSKGSGRSMARSPSSLSFFGALNLGGW